MRLLGVVRRKSHMADEPVNNLIRCCLSELMPNPEHSDPSLETKLAKRRDLTFYNSHVS